jgi:hypothetical protein
MKLARLALSIALLAITVSPATAVTGSQLYDLCSAQDQSEMSCEVYIRGFVDGIMVGHLAGNKFCPPDDGISGTQAKLVIMHWLRDNPEFLHHEAGYLAGIAMVDAFKCPTK